MTDRWQQVEKLCQEALELKESQRGAFLEEACGGDEDLRREVESLLKFDSRGNGFIEAPAWEVAAKMMAHEKPESLIGQQLGSYQIVSLLGAGGMGVVYQARDTRLKRSVAIKVLPADKVRDPERKRRFIQEARAASALNHPNIITIYDIGNEDGINFIVMEYVGGKTLDQRIPRKGMRLNEALKLAVQMADALAKAHSAGIIHRDLKPTNVMVTDQGFVKVLDFGLAKLTEVSESGEEGTRTLQSQTEEGTIIGTLSYMSPEQAEGKKVDARSDIFSFGAVLYEMVTGQKAFQGDSKLSTLAAIVKQDPKAISQLVPDTPPDLEKIINRCLRRDPERRFHHMEDLKVELQELKEESDSGKLAGTSPAVRPVQRSWVWAAAALVVVAIAVSTWIFRGTARKPASAPEVIPLTSYPGIEKFANFSPDGNQVAFSWNGEKQDNFDIYVKLIGAPTPVRLTTDPADDISPAFSPDGRSIGFVRVSQEHRTFIVIPAIGGPERVVGKIHSDDDFFTNFAWFPDGSWIVTTGLELLSTESGETRSLTLPPTKPDFDLSPAVSPDGRTVAFSRLAHLAGREIYLLDLTEELKPKGEPRRLTSLKAFSSNPVWSPNGQEIIFSSSNTGGPFRSSLWKVSAFGAGQPEQLPYGAGEACCLVVSRNGNRAVYERDVYDSNIWRLSLSSPGEAVGAPTRLIASTRADLAPQYSPDGKRIAFESLRTGVHSIWVCDADGSHAVELFSRAGAVAGTARWSPDGEQIAFDFDPERNTDIYVVRASGGKPIRLTTDPGYDAAPSWSRDGKWIYFASTRTGRYEVWKVSAAGGEAVPVTHNGGGTAFESTDSKYLYYVKGDLLLPTTLWRMPVNGGTEEQVLPSVFFRDFSLVNDGIYFIPGPDLFRKSSIQFLNFATGKVKVVAPMSGPPSEGLSVSPDGRSLLFTQRDEAGSDLMLVENFR
jgi:eukaryotic-like serine/threonine-protein kinase